MSETIDYKVNQNNDDIDYNIDYIECLNNPVATMTINMQNQYKTPPKTNYNNMTELFNAHDTSNTREEDNEGFGITFYFDLSSIYFETVNYVYLINKDSANCVETHILKDGRLTSNVEFDYYISNYDWINENTTITELNNNIAKNIVYCLNNNDMPTDKNWNILNNNFYFIAKDNVVYIYSCNNNCIDLSINFFTAPAPLNQKVVVNKSFVVSITNIEENNMNVKYHTLLTGYTNYTCGVPGTTRSI